MSLTELDAAILRAWGSPMLVEGFDIADYQGCVDRMRLHLLENEVDPIDFSEWLAKDPHDFLSAIKNSKGVFVFNMDLFGHDVDPDKATSLMRALRANYNMRIASQLMFARPGANLDYNGRRGYTDFDNHPLGNWCEFYEIKDGSLINRNNPIKNR